MKVIISRDGTVLDASDCVMLECNPAWVDYLTDQLADTDRYNVAIHLGAKHV